MTRAETGTLPPPPTEEQKNEMRLVVLKALATDSRLNEPWQTFGRRLVLRGFLLPRHTDNEEMVEAFRYFVRRLHYGGRSGGIA